MPQGGQGGHSVRRAAAAQGRAAGRADARLLDLRGEAWRPLRAAREDDRDAVSPTGSDAHGEAPLTDSRAQALLEHFRAAFAADPAGAYRDWFRAQEELRESGDAAIARALADDFWLVQADLAFASEEARARFLHNAAVFFGSPGPAADLARARALFGSAAEHFREHADDGWRARLLHNLATALSNLGTSAADLDEALGHFDEALSWRTADREIARAVTLHNKALALRRLAALDPARSAAALFASAEALREAIDIRRRQGLKDGAAASERELEETLALGGSNPRP